MEDENKGNYLIESSPNLPPTTNTKTPARSKTNTNERKISHNISELESFISQWHNKLVLENLKKDVEVEMKRQIIQQLYLHCTPDLVKSLYEQIDMLKSEVYFLREELREKSNLLKIIVTTKIPEAVDGFIQKKKLQKTLITTKEKVCCITDTEDNTSVNNNTINNKESNSNDDYININNVHCNKKMKINNNGCKINDNKYDNYNNLDIEKIISNNIDSKYDSNVKDNNIDNKSEGHTIMAAAATPTSLTSIRIARKSTSTVMMAAKTSTTITSRMTTKETALKVTPRTRIA